MGLIELLDRRVLLSATLSGTTLTITSDNVDGDNTVVVAANRRFVNILTVADSGQLKYFALSAIKEVDVTTFNGDDRIFVDPALDPLALKCHVDSGAGNDRITTGAGADTILAGDGNDKIYSNGRADAVDGGLGNDTIYGGDGNDTITAGSGNDRIYAAAGNDTCDSGKGNDLVDAGDGNDTVNSAGSAVTVLGGAGNDSGVLKSGGIVLAGGGSDNFVSTGGASLFGQAGNDTLQSSFVNGGAGNDTLNGLMGADTVRGGDGDDLIRGFAGRDLLMGDAGNDAIFGGSDTDTLYGGEGDDNLYGTDGYYDKHKDLAGHDDGFGQGGSDWFETNFPWNKGDYRKGEDRAVDAQNLLAIDSSAGLYHGGTLTINNNLGSNSAIDISAGSLTMAGAGTVRLVNNTWTTGSTVISPIPSTILIKPIGNAGWLSSGAYDTAAGRFVPPPMTHNQRIGTARGIVQVPKGWTLGALTLARDEFVWYQVSQDAALPPSASSTPLNVSNGTLTINGGSLGTAGGIINLTGTPLNMTSGTRLVVTRIAAVSLNGGTVTLQPGTYTFNSSAQTLVPDTSTGATAPTPTTTSSTTASETMYTVATLDGGTTQVPQSTPHLYDGVDNYKFRFIGVKAGTILIDGSGSAVADATNFALNSPLLALPSASVNYRLAGHDTIYHPAVAFDTVPTGGPRALRGILLQGGAIWLATDGTEPYFSSGK